MKPDPGTPEAVRLGCICPDYKRQPAQATKYAVERFDLDRWFAVNERCPVHGWRP